MSQDFPAWTFERRIASDLASGHRIREELLTKLQSENWTKRELFGIGLALEEAIVNAIKHGNRLDKSKRVRLVCKSTLEKIWIEISDEGPGFNPGLVPDCTDEAHIECPNGRGIMLMRNFMSRVDYNRCGNAVIMEKLRSSSS
jgi:serine/threonine-protein kinase RsbW